MSDFDGSIKFDAKLDTTELKKDLDSLGKIGDDALSKLEKPAKQTSKKMDDMGKSADTASKDVKKLGDKSKKAAKDVKDVEKEAKGGKKEVKDFGDKADGAARDVKDLGRQSQSAAKDIEKVSKASGKSSEGFSVMKGAAAGLVSGGISSVVSAAKDAALALVNLGKETREYREDIGKLKTGFKTAGFTADAATKVYKDFFSVLGEEDRSVEAVNHLAKLCDTEEQLTDWTTICTGVWGTFGDSLPIEGLTEAANETTKTGQVTGVLADALNWGSLAQDTFGVKMKENTKANKEWNKAVAEASSAEDYFNLALEQCSTEQERQALITSTLNRGYSEAAENYRGLNGDIMAANKAQSDWTDTMARIGEILDPIAADVQQFGADTLNGILDIITNTDTLGEKITEAGDKYQEAKDKAALTEDYAEKWYKLKDAIAEGKLPAEELAVAQEKIKGIEAWFIDNYGNFITAEEQKNGIRAESVKAIEKEVQASEKLARWDFLSSLQENREKVIKLDSEISHLEGMNKYFDEQKVNAATTGAALANLQVQYQHALNNKSTMSDTEFNAELQRIAAAVSELTGEDFGFASLPKLRDMVNKCRDDAEYFGSEIEKNSKKIDENKSSISDFIRQAELFIQTDLGGTYAEVSSELDLMKKAQQELANKGKISEETLNGLAEKLPEIKEHANDPEFLAQKIGEVEQKLKDAETTLDNFGLAIDQFDKTIKIKVEYQVQPRVNMPMQAALPTPHNANGTLNAKEGLSVVNERGTEVIEGKDGSFRYVDSSGAALTHLNAHDKVYTADQTRRMFGNVKKIRGFANGRNNGGSSFLPFRIGGGISADFGSAGERISQTIADGIERNSGAIEKSTEKACRRGLSATERYNARQAEITARQAAESEEEQRKSYEEKLKNAKDAAEKEKLIAEEEKRLQEKAEKDELEALKKAAEAEEKLRDKKFQKLSDDYSDGLITQEQYYSDLADLRDEYYAEGSDEYEKYSQEIMRGLRDKEFDDLKDALDRGYITEKDYYQSLTELRDKYFAKGSEQWKEYSDEIINHQKECIKDFFSQIAETAEKSFETVISTKDKLKSNMASFELTDTFTINGMGTFTDVANIDDVISSNDAYINELTDFRDRLKVAGASEDVTNALMNEVLGMSKKDARDFMRTYAGKSDAYMADYVAKYQTVLNQGEYLSTEFLKDDIKKSQQEFDKEAGNIVEVFREKGMEIPEDFAELGKNSAQRFGKEFSAEIAGLFDNISLELESLNYIPMNSILSKWGGEGQVITNNSYASTYNMLTPSYESRREQIKAARDAEILKRMRGGY